MNKMKLPDSFSAPSPTSSSPGSAKSSTNGPEFFIRCLAEPEAREIFEHFLSEWNLLEVPVSGGRVLLSQDGDPLIKMFPLNKGEANLYFSAPHFPFMESADGQP